MLAVDTISANLAQAKGFEPIFTIWSRVSLENRRFTIKLYPYKPIIKHNISKFGTGKGIRTPIYGFGDRYSAIELYLHKTITGLHFIFRINVNCCNNPKITG